ncbi:hypothetical protein D3C86_1495530 [compost metagenome]
MLCIARVRRRRCSEDAVDHTTAGLVLHDTLLELGRADVTDQSSLHVGPDQAWVCHELDANHIAVFKAPDVGGGNVLDDEVVGLDIDPALCSGRISFNAVLYSCNVIDNERTSSKLAPQRRTKQAAKEQAPSKHRPQRQSEDVHV